MPNCEQGKSKPEDFYALQEVPNTFFPYSSNFEQLQSLNEDECRRLCLSDCNCVVAVIKEGSCWKKKLPLSNGRKDYNIYGKALVKVNEPSRRKSNTGNKDQTTLVLAGAILLGSSALLIFLFIVAVSLFLLQPHNRRRKLTRSSSRNYVAVKKLERMVQEGEKEFKTEARAIAKTHHKNLVRLLGFCDEGPNRLLVYEFMSNGTLAGFLFGISRPDWNKRIQMAFGIARALTYLHEECSTKSLDMESEKEEEIILADWAYDCYRGRKLDELVKADEEVKNDMKTLERLVMVSIWCIQEDPSLRPSMRTVTQMLEGIVQVSVPPCPSPFSSIC
ncbi:receptor-like protein kinase 1 [Populus alba x Populus x berolinensis]|nr:receptor-like protein kinase 1 [Populus alba x Populus x berolinensis]